MLFVPPRPRQKQQANFQQPRQQAMYQQPRQAGGPAPTRLSLLCKQPKHALPCRMTNIGIGTSPRGQEFAVYACPLCGWREGWVLDWNTNAPRRLWAGFNASR